MREVSRKYYKSIETFKFNDFMFVLVLVFGLLSLRNPKVPTPSENNFLGTKRIFSKLIVQSKTLHERWENYHRM